jgi:hypothetical protein
VTAASVDQQTFFALPSLFTLTLREARYRRGAKAPPELLLPKSKATLDKLQRWTAPAGGER